MNVLLLFVSCYEENMLGKEIKDNNPNSCFRQHTFSCVAFIFLVQMKGTHVFAVLNVCVSFFHQ